MMALMILKRKLRKLVIHYLGIKDGGLNSCLGLQLIFAAKLKKLKKKKKKKQILLQCWMIKKMTILKMMILKRKLRKLVIHYLGTKDGGLNSCLGLQLIFAAKLKKLKKKKKKNQILLQCCKKLKMMIKKMMILKKKLRKLVIHY